MYTIDGVPLSDADGRWGVLTTSDARTPVAMRSVSVSAPGVDGNIPIYGENVESTALTVNMFIRGTSWEDMTANIDFIRRLVTKTYAPLQFKQLMGVSSRVADAKLASMDAPTAARLERVVTQKFTFTIPAGVWRDEDTTDWTHPAPTSSVKQTVVALAGGTARISDALALITGPAVSPKLTDPTTGAWVQYTGTVDAGTQLLIDCREWRATVGSAVDWNSTGAGATKLLTNGGPDSAVRLFTLTPKSTAETPATYLTLTADGRTSATACVLRTRRAYY